MKFKQILKKALKYVVTPFALVGGIIGLYSIDSYAYSTNQFSYTFDSYSTSSNQYILHYDSDIDLTTKSKNQYLLLANFNANFNNFGNNTNSFYFVNYVGNNESAMNLNFYLIRSNPSTLIFRLNYSGVFDSNDFKFFCTNFDIVSNNVLLNIDLVSYDELTISPYYDSYIQNLNNQLDSLQSDYDTLQGQYDTLEDNYESLQGQYDTLENNYNTLENEYEQKQNEYDMLSNGQLGYLDYMEFYINNQSIEFGNDSETELNLNELIEYNLYANNSLNLAYFTTQQVNPNYLPLKIVSYYDKLPVNLFSMYFNGGTTGFIKVGYYNNSQFLMKQISFDNTGTAVDSVNTSLINYDVFNGLSVEYIEYIEINFNNADSIAGSINFNSNYNIAYSNGYTNGYNYGYNVSDNINRELINNARQEGYQSGYDVGKQEGIEIGSDENNSLYGVVIRTL